MYLNYKAAFLSLVLVSGSVIPVFSQEKPQKPEENKLETLYLTVDDAVNYALEGNLSLKQSQISLRTSERASEYSWSSFIPTITGSAAYSTDPTSADDSSSISLGATASLRLTPALYTTIRNTKLSYEKNQMDYESAVRSIELQVRKIYYSLLYSQENISLLKNNVESAKNQYDQNQARYNRGALARIDVLSAQVSYQNSEASLKTAENSFNSSLESFKQLLGIPLPQEVILKGSLNDILELGDIDITGIEISSASFKSIEKQIEIVENSLLAARFSAYGPSLSASFGYTYAGSNRTAGDGSYSFSGSPSLSFSASIPLDGYIPWSSGALSIENQKDTIESLYLQLDDAKTTATMNVQSYVNQLQLERETVELRKSSIDVAQQTYDLTQEAYSRGTKDLLTLQSASDSLLQAKVNLMSEAYNMVVALLNLEDALGIPYGSLGVKAE